MTSAEIETMIQTIDNAISIAIGRPVEYQLQSAESNIMAKRHSLVSLYTLRANYAKLLEESKFAGMAYLGTIK